MSVTTLQISVGTRKKLASFRDYPRETYDEILQKLMAIVSKFKDEGELSGETLKDVQEARKQYAAGQGMSTRELLKKLGA